MAARSLKNIAKEAGEMSAAQKADKARRSYKKSLANVKRDIASGTLSTKQLEKALNVKSSLESSINASYFDRKTGEYLNSPDRMLKNADIAKEMIDYKYDESVYERRNQLFQRDINQASIGGVSTKSKEEVKVFYAMTKEYWEGSDISVRNKKIMAAFGADTLEEVWDKVMSNEDAQKALKMANDKNLEDGSNDVKDEIGSPDYIKWLINVRDESREKLHTNE